MGLAFGSLSSSNASTRTVFENMKARNLVDRDIFSFYFGKSSLAGGSNVIFGGMGSSRIKPGYPPQILVDQCRERSGQLQSGHQVEQRLIQPLQESDYRWDHRYGNDTDYCSQQAGTHNPPSHTIRRQLPGAKPVGPSWAVPCGLVSRSDKRSKAELEIEGKRFGFPFEDLVRKEIEESMMYFSGIQTSSASL